MKSYPLILSLLLAVVVATNPGGTASLDIEVLKQAKDVYFKLLMNVIANLEVPDIDFDGGYLRQNSLHINEAVQDFKINHDQGLNGIRFELTNLEAQFKSNDFNYDKGLLKAKGNMDIDIKSIYIGFTE